MCKCYIVYVIDIVLCSKQYEKHQLNVVSHIMRYSVKYKVSLTKRMASVVPDYINFNLGKVSRNHVAPCSGPSSPALITGLF